MNCLLQSVGSEFTPKVCTLPLSRTHSVKDIYEHRWLMIILFNTNAAQASRSPSVPSSPNEDDITV